MKVVVVDSGVANIASLCFALERLGVQPKLSAEPAQIAAAERVILPGVGAAAPAMARLNACGLTPVLRELRAPLLGICLGMQLLFAHSEEGDVEGLGLLPGRVRRMRPGPGVRVPHMGWNALEPTATASLLDGVQAGAQAYFVHSFAAAVGPDCIARCVHGEPFAALVQRGRVAGAQFHPERSAEIGARILRNFIDQGLA